MGRTSSEVNERTALLANGQPQLADNAPEVTIASAQPATDARLPRRAIVTFAICASSLFFIILGGMVLTPASNQIGEEIICRQFHPDIADGRDPRCKDNRVQGELALIDGVALPLFLLPGILTAVPYGLFADTYGRRLGIALAMLGLLLQAGATLAVYAFPAIFPIRAVWFASLFTLIGGGGTVLNAHIFATISNVAPGAHKTLLFSYLGAALTAAELTGSPLAWLLMQHGAWLTIYVSFFFLCVGALFSLFIPQLPMEAKAAAVLDTATGSASDVAKASLVKRQLVAAGRKVQHIFRTQFLEQRTLGLLLCSLAFTTFGKAFTTTLAQYVSRRYGWSWADTGLLSSLQGGITMVTTSVFIPLLDRLLRQKWSWTLFEKDIFLAQLSLAIMTIGYFGIGSASTSAVMLAFLSFMSLSKGHEFIMRSLLAQAAGEANVGVVYTTNSVLETVGMAVAGPLMAAAFRRGLEWGGVMIGFPFFVASVVLFLGSCLVWIASRTAKVDLHHEHED
ncbi:hypothetical protein NLG97_g2554 [Lecanicillium saksenae]|uniref:Uncharacterized protein n=1 Tax=Lecanicillium saksenae TaxID=468837 RepID=A0ACC1R0T7_9HYPO|nr:hypothetical protein NLG97_g2554 [Lecanicillium saksenae]